MKEDPLQIGFNALANSSRMPIKRAQLLAILATGDGPDHLVRALFEDCSLESLERMAIAIGRSRRQIMDAYRVARVRHGAKSPELDDWLAEDPAPAAAHRAHNLTNI